MAASLPVRARVIAPARSFGPTSVDGHAPSALPLRRRVGGGVRVALERRPPPAMARPRPRARASSAALLALASFASSACSLIRAADAHPTLLDPRKCGEDAHPRTKRDGHAAPVADPSISFLMSWSSPDGSDAPQADETDPLRVIPDDRHVATAEFRPGARHTLTVTTPLAGELILTATAGQFEDFGQRQNGNLGYGAGWGCRAGCCDGLRYNVKIHVLRNHFVWRAPNATDDDDADARGGPVVFKVTAAHGARFGFRTNSATFLPNPALPRPGEPRSSDASNNAGTHYPPPSASTPYAPDDASDASDDDDRFDARFVAHAWLMTLAWAVLIPLGVWSARYARRPPEAPPSPSALAESIRRGWFACHKVFAGLGLAAAALGWLLAHRAVDDVLGEEAHLDTAHACYGAGALLLGLYQPLNAWLRPPGPEHPGDARSPARARWEAAHRIAAAGGCALSVAATATGLDRAEEAWGAERGARAGGRAYAAWLVAIAIATAALERARFRERKGAWEGGGAGARTFVELSEDVGAGEEDRDPDPRGEEEAGGGRREGAGEEGSMGEGRA